MRGIFFASLAALALCAPIRSAGAAALAVAPPHATRAATPSADEPGPHHADLRGIRVYYETYGKGPALILLHGGMGDGRQFSKQVPAFEPHYRLVIPDACAQGRTTDRPGPLSYHAMAEDVLALMDRLRIPRARVVGWSDGGVIGLDLAIHHPGRISHLVTFGANYSLDGLDAGDRAWGDTATAAGLGEGSRRGYAEIAPDPKHFEVAMNKVLAMWRTEPGITTADLGRIRARTMIVAGEHDLIRREHSESLAKAIPGAKLWIVPGANHGVMIDKADQVNPVVLDFLSR